MFLPNFNPKDRPVYHSADIIGQLQKYWIVNGYWLSEQDEANDA